MSHSDQDIPTLTDFIRIGDEDMHHHFDAQQFSIDQDEPWASTDIDTSNEVAFAADTFNNVNLADHESETQADNTRWITPDNETGTNDFNPQQIATVEVDQVLSELAPFDPALVDDETPTDEPDEYLELDVQEVISAATPSMQMSSEDVEQASAATAEDIRQQIDLAVDELMPGIAEQLKQNLYRHFNSRSDTD